MHVHTSETSGCGKISGKEIARLYHQAGYQGIMITDHFHKEYFNGLGDRKSDQKIEQYLLGYHLAKKEGEKEGLDVVLGIEFRNVETDNDFLIVGVTEEFLFEHYNIYELPLVEAIKTFHENGMLVIQAHPVRFAIMERIDGKFFRRYSSDEMIEILRTDPEMPKISQKEWKNIQISGKEKELPSRFVLQVCELQCEKYLDGIEIYNGNIEWAQEPEKIQEIINRHPEYLKISASDCHEKIHLARGGMVLDRRIKNSEELKSVLLDNGIKEWICH